MANTETNQDKLKALQLTLDKIEKNFGKGSVMKLGDNVVEDVAVIPSGSIGLDRIPERPCNRNIRSRIFR